MGLWYLLAIEMGDLQCLESWIGALWWSCTVWGCPFSLGLEEAIGTGLEILETSVRIDKLPGLG